MSARRAIAPKAVTLEAWQAANEGMPVARYTLKNLKEIEDMAPAFGLSPMLEARFARDPLECEKLALSYQRIAPNSRTPFGHKHAAQEEVYVCVGGSGRIKVGDEVIELGRWDAIRVAAETMRALEAGPEGAEIIAIGAPSTRPNDAEMVPGWWTD